MADSQAFRRRVFDILEGAGTVTGTAVVRNLLAFLITLNLFAVALESVADIAVTYGVWFDNLLQVSLGLFSIEFLARVWSSVEHPSDRYAHPLKGRFRYLVTPLALLDLLALMPLWLGFPPGSDARLLRIVRLLWLLKVMRYLPAIATIANVFQRRWRVLVAAMVIMVTTLLIASTLMFYTERDIQPDSFASIPQAMWWGMTTLTTVGYGDVVPVSATGRIIGMIIMMLGIAMFALPTAILATAFIEESKHSDFLVTWKLVAGVPLFSELKADEISRIAELLQPRTLMPNEIVCQRDERADSMFFILSGQLEVELVNGPKTMGHGDFFGEIALLKGQQRTVTVVARTYAELVELDGEDFQQLLNINAELRAKIETVAEQRLEQAPV